MPKTRELSQAEKFYIENNTDKTDNQLSSIMPGVGPKTVAKFRSELPPKDEMHESTSTTTETPQARIKRLSGGLKAGELMARNNNGTVTMTEAASEVVDARKAILGNQMTKEEYTKNNRYRIHTIDPSKPSQ